ncbi:hypothetical protein SB719_19610, partial [Pantoea sp. SIMBA_079]|uniref:hypothetical protein n=1 Tax=Pantoea sp. SIMBA_079 TaxID=3085817 RepID=UPI003995C0A5
SRLIQSAAGKNLEAFFGALKAHIEKRAAPADSARNTEPAPQTPPDDALPSGVAQAQSQDAAKPSTVMPASRPTFGPAPGVQVWMVAAGSGLFG